VSVLFAERPPRPTAPVPWILTSFLVGVLLVFAPWLPWLWESNWLLQLWPGLRVALLSPFVRGAVTGLGLVNVLLALYDLYERVTGRS
jgi:hypothetical protein